MSLKFEINELTDLMKNFYILTGIRIVIFDECYNEIISYPENGNEICACMRQNPEFDALCRQSDKRSFERCKKTQDLYMYHCHAGLMEAAMSIMDGASILGYIMFGQIADKKDKEKFREHILDVCRKYNAQDIMDKVERIKYKSDKQIVAAAKILEACTSYILHKNLVKPSRIQLFNSIDEYVSNNMSDDISVESLCERYSISRTRLYEAMRPYINGGIARYIREKRLEKAKELLKTTEMSVSEICDFVGFLDYNYFLRSFKKQYGISTKKVRES